MSEAGGVKAWSRRELLIASGGALVLAACSGSSKGSSGGNAVGPTDPAVERRDALRRPASASTVNATITAAPVTAVIGGRDVQTWAFGDRPGSGGIRAQVGDLIEATFVNALPSANTLHWHGIALRNDMDGVHDLTQPAVETGGEFTYRFTVPDAGTYWFHPHVGLELDKGLYAPLIVEDPSDPVAFDVDVTLMLDDWLDGHGRTQEQVLADLQAEGGHSMDMTETSAGETGTTESSGGERSMTGGLTGDVSYPLHVINGRGPSERETVDAKAGQRVRIRLINAGSDTAYRLAIGEHRLTVTHADGFPVVPVEVDNVVLGMGERYDVIVRAGSGTFPIVAVPEGKNAPAAEAVLRTDRAVSVPAVGSRPSELSRRAITYADLVATDASRLPSRQPDRTETITLTESENGYVHGINGVSYPDSAPIAVAEDGRLRLKVVNDTMMFHPIHLHGHTFQIVGDGSARKDTVNVLPMSSALFDIAADNPGQWMLHCHNTYHFETGMATVLSYRA